MASQLYERIGRGYARTRRPDPRIERRIHAALGDAASVLNVGAGTGSYEPADRYVLAIEPSARMRAQRPSTAAPCLPGGAEALPLDDDSVDLAMALYTDFHWSDRRRGIDEMIRVSRRGVVMVTVDRDVAEEYWLTRDYLPSANDLFDPLSAVTELFPTPPTVDVIPIPHDCQDGFVHAYWRRPAALLDPDRHGTMALFARLEPAAVERGLSGLRADVASGAWAQRHGWLTERPEHDLGHRLVTWRPAG